MITRRTLLLGTTAVAGAAVLPTLPTVAPSGKVFANARQWGKSELSLKQIEKIRRFAQMYGTGMQKMQVNGWADNLVIPVVPSQTPLETG